MTRWPAEWWLQSRVAVDYEGELKEPAMEIRGSGLVSRCRADVVGKSRKGVQKQSCC